MRDGPIDENEIEVTEEMIRAGVRELRLFNPSNDVAEDVVTEIYRAMEAIKKLQLTG